QAPEAQVGSGVVFQGMSAARYSEQQLSGGLTKRRTASVPRMIMPVLPPETSWLPNPAARPEMRMNLDLSQPSAPQNEVDQWEL
ncbi:MAG TPA: hypothetical protein DEQ55_02595, partial [Pseudomonas sp.]|nr:hypothetical protein [Pseudomonas sp.]